MEASIANSTNVDSASMNWQPSFGTGVQEAQHKAYEAIVTLLGGRPTGASFVDDEGAQRYETLSPMDATQVATDIDDALASNVIDAQFLLELGQQLPGGTDELIDILSRSAIAEQSGSSLHVLSEALFARGEGSDLGDASAALRAASPYETHAASNASSVADRQSVLAEVLSVQQALAGEVI